MPGSWSVQSGRYRRAPTSLALPFIAPSDSGFTLDVELPRDSALSLQLTATASGLPSIPGLVIPPRPDDVVPIQNGDVTVRFRRVRLP